MDVQSFERPGPEWLRENGIRDDTDRLLVNRLQVDGRATLAELARDVGLSAPSVSDRIRRLEAAGVIRGYAAIVDLETVGYALSAFVRFAAVGSDPGLIDGTSELMKRPEILEAHHVVGEDCWVFRVVAHDTAHLERLLLEFSHYGRTTTSIILSTPVERRAIEL